MKKILFVLIAFVGFLAGQCLYASDQSSSAGYVRGEIYLYSWHARTRSRMTIDGVRENKTVKIEISDESATSDFVESLHLDRLEPSPVLVDDTEPRLVIDLYRRDGSVESYFADNWHLYEATGKKRMKINADFKHRFEFANDATEGEHQMDGE